MRGDPLPDPFQQLRLRRVLRVPEAALQPQLGARGVGGGHQHVGVVHGEVRVAVAVDEQQRGRRDQRNGLGGRQRDRVPVLGMDAGAQAEAGDQAAGGPGDDPVEAAHRCGAAVVPAGGGAHRDHDVGVRTCAPPTLPLAVNRRMPQHDRAAHREPDGGDPAVPQGPRPADRGGQIMDLLVADRGVPAGAAVPTEGERDHAGTLGECGGRPAQRGAFQGAAETVREDHGQIIGRRSGGGRTGGVSGLDANVVLRQQRRPMTTRSDRRNTGTCKIGLGSGTHVSYSVGHEGSGQRCPRVLLCFQPG